MRICLYGSSSPDLEDVFYKKAYELGEAMASRGHKLIFGGGEQGLMGACVRGLESKGGEAVGVAPRFFDLPGILHKDCSEFIFTDDMRERKQIMEQMAEAFIIVPGGVGTYEEFFETFTLKQLGQINKPIGMLNISGYFDLLKELMEQTVEKGFMKKECSEIYGIFEDADELLDYVENVCEEPMDVYKLKLGH
ncbi:MAG: TIGR00730 family Rossman fold protein [Firmicutes bacterium]|nr:TIGR00730 family Rossman fold protein [Bacillota bacterium]